MVSKSWLASTVFFFFFACLEGHIFSMNSSWVSAALSAIFIPEHSWFRKMSLTQGSQTLVSTACRCHIWSASACGGWRKSRTLHWALQKTRRTSNGLHMTTLLIDRIYPSFTKVTERKSTQSGTRICFCCLFSAVLIHEERKDSSALTRDGSNSMLKSCVVLLWSSLRNATYSGLSGSRYVITNTD